MLKNPKPSAKITSIRNKDKRANIPTEELRDSVADEELAPKTMLYPRDPSLDPQLVCKGKDEQDSVALSSRAEENFYVVQISTKVIRTLSPDDHRPRRLGARSDLRHQVRLQLAG